MTGRVRFLHPLAGASALALAGFILWQVATPHAQSSSAPRAGAASAAQPHDRAVLLAQVESLQADASKRRGQGDSVGAGQALVKGGAILQELRSVTPFDPDVLRLLGINAYWLGQLAKDRNELATAIRHWQTYLELAGQLSRLQPNNPEWWIERSYALNNLGSLAVAGAGWTRAAHAFTASIALKERALALRPDDAVLMGELSDSYSWLGTAREALGQLDAAANLYAQEMALVARLRARSPEALVWVERESRALQRRAALALARGNDDAALADFRRAARAFDDMTAAHPENRFWQIEQANLALRIEAILARGATDSAAATARLAAIHSRLSRLQQLDGGKRVWSQTEAVARARLGLTLMHQGRLLDARRQVRAGAARLDALVAGAAGNVNLRLAAAGTLLLLAEIDTALLQPDSARDACEQARALLQETSAGTMDHRVLDPWVRLNLCLGKDAAAREGARRLHAIGYRDGDYRRFISNQLEGHP